MGTYGKTKLKEIRTLGIPLTKRKGRTREQSIYDFHRALSSPLLAQNIQVIHVNTKSQEINRSIWNAQ